MRLPLPAAGLLTLALCITACTGPTTPNPGPTNPGPTPGPVTPADPDQGVALQPLNLFITNPKQLTVQLDISQSATLSFKNGRVLSVSGTVPTGLSLTLDGSVLTLTARPDLTEGVSADLTLSYGVPGQPALTSAPLSIGSVPTAPVVVPTDPDLGKVFPERTVTLDFTTPNATVDYSSMGLSFKYGRTLWVEMEGDTPDGVHAHAPTGQPTVRLSLSKSTDSDVTSQVPVSYRDSNGKVLIQGTITVIHRADTPLVSTTAGWREEERELLRLINEVRTTQTLNGERVWAEGCISEFYEGDLKPLLPLDSARLAALKHSSYLGLEGRDTSSQLAPHLEITSSPRFYGETPVSRVNRAATEVTDRLRSQGAGENIIFADFALTPAEAVMGWIRSPGHCRNLINRDITHVGYALTEDGLTDDSPTTGWKRWARNYTMVTVIGQN